jgi:hypothetical protein
MRLITLTKIAGGETTVTTATVTLTTTDGSAKFSDSVEDFSSYVGRRVTFVDNADKEATAFISEISGSDYLLVDEAYGSTRNMESEDDGFASGSVVSVVVGDKFMFDGYLESQTETAEEISETFSISGFNCLCLFNTYGIEAELTIGASVQTISLIRDSIKDWWDYFFAPSRIGRDCVFYFPTQTGDVRVTENDNIRITEDGNIRIPEGSAASGTATLKIKYTGGTAKCGLCVLGVAREIMTTRYDVQIGISDYSKYITDDFGDTYLSEGNWAKRVNVKMFSLKPDFDIAFREVIKNRATACVFDYNEYSYELTEAHTSENGYSSLVVYGYTEDFRPRIGEALAEATHEAQGLI